MGAVATALNRTNTKFPGGILLLFALTQVPVVVLVIAEGLFTNLVPPAVTFNESLNHTSGVMEGLEPCNATR